MSGLIEFFIHMLGFTVGCVFTLYLLGTKDDE